MSITKTPSEKLTTLIEEAVKSLHIFADIWTQIKQQGEQEGFTEDECKDLVRPALKKQLTKHQIRYLFNPEDRKERNRQAYQETKGVINTPINHKEDTEQSTSESGTMSQNDDKNDIEKSSISEEILPVTVLNAGTTPAFTSAADLSNSHKDPDDFKFEKEQLPPLNINEELKAEIERLKEINDRYSTELTELRDAVTKTSFSTAKDIKQFTFDNIPNADNVNTFMYRNVKFSDTRKLFEPIAMMHGNPDVDVYVHVNRKQNKK